jgi:hypothetical protein
MMWWIESWCTLLMVKPENILIGCILSFQWNHVMYILGYMHVVYIMELYVEFLIHGMKGYEVILV